MNIDLARLREFAVSRSEDELAIEADHLENSDLYRASVEIALKIRHAMDSAGISEEELSGLMNMDTGEIYRYLSGREDMRLKVLVLFEKVLGVHIIDRTIDPDFPREQRMQKVIVFKSDSVPLQENYVRMDGESHLERKLVLPQRRLKKFYSEHEVVHRCFNRHPDSHLKNISI